MSPAHACAVVWNPESIDIVVDHVSVRRIDQSPDYPMQLMIGVFDFPARDPSGLWADHVPELVVSSVKGAPLLNQEPIHRHPTFAIPDQRIDLYFP